MAETIILRKIAGKITTDKALPYIFSTLKNGTYTITIKKASEKRTIDQNKLMWMWLACIERETCTPKEDIYMYYCKKFLQKTIQVGERLERIYNTSSHLNTEQMSEFLTKIKVDAKTELGIDLPEPKDQFFEDFYQQFNY